MQIFKHTNVETPLFMYYKSNHAYYHLYFLRFAILGNEEVLRSSLSPFSPFSLSPPFSSFPTRLSTFSDSFLTTFFFLLRLTLQTKPISFNLCGIRITEAKAQLVLFSSGISIASLLIRLYAFSNDGATN